MTPPPDRDGPGGPTESPTSDAERSRRYRERKKAEAEMALVQFSKGFLSGLVREGRAGPEEIKDPRTLGEILEDICDTKTRGNFEPGPICTTGTATS